MRRVAVPRTEEDVTEARPDEAARKRVAVELIRDHDRPLKWTAHRYSICAEDAEDAYQRGIEILLSKAPSTDMGYLLPWARKVIKHEALAIRKTRERTLARPVQDRDEDHADDDWIQLIPSSADGPDELTLKRERIARSREALGQLKPAELKALTQLAEGFSYQEIGDMNQWSRTKVNRCLAEGRARFRTAFKDSEAGERCVKFEPLISACCDGELDRSQLGDLEKHLAACGHCRSTLRAYRAAPKAAAALAPLLPATHTFWERAQVVAVDLQTRLQGIGRGSDPGVHSVLTSGGTRGAGMAALAKLAAVCAGTAGTAAVCAATGVLPAANLLPHHGSEPRVERTVRAATPEPPRQPMVFVESEPTARPQPGSADAAAGDQATAESPEPASEEPVVTASAPAPTPTEAEFTPEAAGTPAPAAATPSQPASSSSPVPVGNGGGEFSP
ncbi:MAG: sigma-70 family RNA polymerase sigma factor [Solirubrobacterales bacterium]|nr:sigma-70 family RNA polymerase sigma factor [Solirubrobacterales bacterium]